MADTGLGWVCWGNLGVAFGGKAGRKRNAVGSGGAGVIAARVRQSPGAEKGQRVLWVCVPAAPRSLWAAVQPGFPKLGISWQMKVLPCCLWVCLKVGVLVLKINSQSRGTGNLYLGCCVRHAAWIVLHARLWEPHFQLCVNEHVSSKAQGTLGFASDSSSEYTFGCQDIEMPAIRPSSYLPPFLS